MKMKLLMSLCVVAATAACGVSGPKGPLDDEGQGGSISGNHGAGAGADGSGAADVGSSGGGMTGPVAGPSTTASSGSGSATTGAGSTGSGAGGPTSCVDMGGDIECDPMGGECAGAGSACDVANTGQMMTFITSCFPPPNSATLGASCDNQNGPYCAAGLACVSGSCSPYCCGDNSCQVGSCVIGGHEWSGTSALAQLGVCR